MISIIICSTNKTTDVTLVTNIANTIGTEYEIVHIDNSEHKYNIFEAFNLGVKLSKGDYLCFMHEDVVFHSQDWGQIVEHYLKMDYVGALGVAGGNVVAGEMDWRFYGFGVVHLIQGASTIEEQPQYYHFYTPPVVRNSPLLQVALLDGVFICIRKNMFNQIKFDDSKFHDFHLYDSDICMQVNAVGKAVFVTRDILLEHKSMGTFTSGFNESLAIFFEKWKSYIPMVRGAYVRDNEIKTALDNARKPYESRIKADACLVSLREVFKKKQLGLPCRDYTEEEIDLMEKSAYAYRKACIKDKTMPHKKVKELIDIYRSYTFVRHKNKLLLKYYWHRFVKGK